MSKVREEIPSEQKNPQKQPEPSKVVVKENTPPTGGILGAIIDLLFGRTAKPDKSQNPAETTVTIEELTREDEKLEPITDYYQEKPGAKKIEIKEINMDGLEPEKEKSQSQETEFSPKSIQLEEPDLEIPEIQIDNQEIPEEMSASVTNLTLPDEPQQSEFKKPAIPPLNMSQLATDKLTAQNPGKALATPREEEAFAKHVDRIRSARQVVGAHTARVLAQESNKQKGSEGIER